EQRTVARSGTDLGFGAAQIDLSVAVGERDPGRIGRWAIHPERSRFAGPEPKLDAAVEVRATERERDSRGARLATSVPRISVVERVAAACLGRLDAELPGVDQIAYAWQAGSTVGIDRRRVRVDPRLPPAPL